MTAASPSPGGDREALVGALLDELGRWGDVDRRQAFESWLRRSISLTHLLVLAILEARGPISMSTLAGVLDVSVASATGIVSRLERRGLVSRMRGAAPDLRIVQVALTDQGRRILDELEVQQRDYLERLLAEVAADDLPTILAAVRVLGTARERLLGHEPAQPAAMATDPAASGPPSPAMTSERAAGPAAS